MKSAFGDKGYNELTAGVHAGEWYAIKAVNGSNANVDVTNRAAGGDNSSGLTILAGDIIYVTAVEIVVNSGTVHAYRQ